MIALLRSALLTCLGVTVVAAPGQAWADLPGGAKLAFEDLLIRKGQSLNLVEGNEEEDRAYFNRAHCYCSVEGAAASSYVETEFAYELRLTNRTTAVNRPGELYTGADCSTTTSRPNCELVGTIGDLDAITNTPNRTLVRIHKLISPKATGDQDRCAAVERKSPLWVGSDGDANGDLEYWVSQGIDVDTNPPPIPTEVSAKAGESGVVMKWTNAKERQSDLFYYQFLCAKVAGSSAEPALKEAKKARFQRPAELCGLTTQGEITFSGSGGAPAWLSDPEAYVCGEVEGTAQTYRITGLTNGVKHQVAMVAVDRAGNAAGVYLLDELVPEEVVDFWEGLHDEDPSIEGGYCLAARAYGDQGGLTQALRAFRDDTLARSSAGRWLIARYYQASDALAPHVVASWARALTALALSPLVLVALAWHVLTLPGLVLAIAVAVLLRRKLGRVARRRLAVTAVVAAALVPGPALAQSIGPYWEDDLATEDQGPATTSWHVGLRLGPYTPAIDESVPGQPYEDTFGGATWMPVIDVDYVVLDRFGQVAVGLSAGFMGVSGNTYKLVPDPEDMTRMIRQETTDKTRFRLLPVALTAAYRLTVLDDRFGVPIVPYARGGLAYYTWWIEAPSGEVASVCRPGGMSCDENLARGGTLGLVGSLGLSIRAERIDAEAAAAMREGGVLHAGFYAEVSAARVDDFGIGNKLSVGDVTWFAGVDFEF